MEPSDLSRRQIIDSLMPANTENVGEVAIVRWEMISAQIISIIGEGGFNALYSRSIFLARATFPWLPDNSQPPQANNRFALLKDSLERQKPVLARAANHLLLTSFTNILASLIGEDLTIRILHSAWSNDALIRSSQELKHE